MAIWSRKNLAFSKIETKWSCSNVYLSKKYGKLGSPLYLSLYTCEMWPAFLPCDCIYRMEPGSAGGAKISQAPGS